MASPRRWRSFLFRLEKRVFGRFKAFFFLGDIIYHLENKNRLNRIFGKNNFHGEIGQKKVEKSAIFFLLKINNLQHFLKNFEKKSLPIRKKVVNLRHQTTTKYNQLKSYNNEN